MSRPTRDLRLEFILSIICVVLLMIFGLIGGVVVDVISTARNGRLIKYLNDTYAVILVSPVPDTYYIPIFTCAVTTSAALFFFLLAKSPYGHRIPSGHGFSNWRKSIFVYLRFALLSALTASYFMFHGANTFKALSVDALFWKTSPYSEILSAPISTLSEVRSGCVYRKMRKRLKVELSFLATFDNGESIDLYAARAAGSHLEAIETIKRRAELAGIEIAFVHTALGSGRERTRLEIDKACIEKVERLYSKKNEVRAKQILGLDL